MSARQRSIVTSVAPTVPRARLDTRLRVLQLILFALAGPGCTRPASAPAQSIVAEPFASDLDSLVAAFTRLEHAARVATDTALTRRAYREARIQYKRVEPMLEAVFPPLGFLLNNRSVDGDHDDAPPLPDGWTASGFPAVEALVFGGDAMTGDSTLASVARHAREATQWGRQRLPVLYISDSVACEALRLGLARLGTLGIAGYDAPPDGELRGDWRAGLQGLGALASVLAPPFRDSLTAALHRGEELVAAASRSDAMDRLAFVRDVIRPAAHAVHAGRRAAGIATPVRRGLWRGDARLAV